MGHGALANRVPSQGLEGAIGLLQSETMVIGWKKNVESDFSPSLCRHSPLPYDRGDVYRAPSSLKVGFMAQPINGNWGLEQKCVFCVDCWHHFSTERSLISL